MNEAFDEVIKEGFESRTGYSQETTAKNQAVVSFPQKPDLKPDALDTHKMYLMRTEKFTLPRIYKGKSEWFIEYYFQNPVTGKADRFRIRGKINYEKNLSKRMELASLLKEELTKALRNGNVPTRYLQKKKNSKELIHALESMSRSEALGKSVDTWRNYNLAINRVKKFLTATDQENILMADFKNDQAQKFKEYLMGPCQLSNVSVNCTIQPLKTFLQNYFLQKEIDINPFAFVKYLPKHRGSTFTAFTTEERIIIAGELRKNYPELYLFCNFIYTCFTRPIETCALTSKDLDTGLEFVQVRMENSKVSHTSYRQITAGLRQLLLEYNIKSMPGSDLIFKSITGSAANIKARRKRVTELWNKVVIKKLGIEKEMYGLKHTGNIDYLKALDNVGETNLIWLQRQNDHTSLDTTQKYIRDLGVYKMKREHLPFGLL